MRAGQKKYGNSTATDENVLFFEDITPDTFAVGEEAMFLAGS